MIILSIFDFDFLKFCSCILELKKTIDTSFDFNYIQINFSLCKIINMTIFFKTAQKIFLGDFFSSAFII